MSLHRSMADGCCKYKPAFERSRLTELCSDFTPYRTILTSYSFARLRFYVFPATTPRSFLESNKAIVAV